MGLLRTIKYTGQGSWFGHGRVLGIHKPWDTAINKAKDPYINLLTLTRIYKNPDKTVSNAARGNLERRIESGNIDLATLSALYRLDKQAAIYALIRSKESPAASGAYKAIGKFINAISLEEIDQLARSGNYSVLCALAASERTPADVLGRLAYIKLGKMEYQSWGTFMKQEHKNISYGVSGDTNTGNWDWNMYDHKDSEIKKELMTIYTHIYNEKLLTLLANNPNTPKETLVKLAAAGRILNSGGYDIGWSMSRTFDVALDAIRNLLRRDLITPEDIATITEYNETILRDSYSIYKQLTREHASRRLQLSLSLIGEQYFYSDGADDYRKIDKTIDIGWEAFSQLDQGTLTKDELEDLVETRSDKVLQVVARHPCTPRAALVKRAALFSSKKLGVIIYEALKDTLTVDELSQIAADFNDDVKELALQHPKMPKHALMEAATHSRGINIYNRIESSLTPADLAELSGKLILDDDVLVKIIKNKKTPIKVLIKFAKDGLMYKDRARETLTAQINERKNEFTPDDIVDILSAGGFMEFAVTHPHAPRKVQFDYALGKIGQFHDADKSAILNSILKNMEKEPFTPDELARLSESRHAEVQERVAKHKNTPRILLFKFAMGELAERSFAGTVAFDRIFDSLTEQELEMLSKSRNSQVRRKISLIKTTKELAKTLGMTAQPDLVRRFLSRMDDEGGEQAVNLIRALANTGIIQKYGLDGIDRLKELSGRNTVRLLQALTVLLQKGLLAGLVSVPRSFDSQRAEVQGHFNGKDPIHLLINYFEAIKLFNDVSSKTPEFDEYLSMLTTDSSRSLKVGIPKEVRLELRGVVYEAYLLRKKILEISDWAHELGRSVLIVANKSYGEVALSPIMERRGPGHVISGTNIPVVSTKVGSTECHNNEFVLDPGLFSSQTTKFILEKNPIVMVVDASTSVSDPNRTSPHIPDAFKGYRNFFMAANQAINGKVLPQNFGEDGKFEKHLASSDDFAEFMNNARHSHYKPEKPEPYTLHFWQTGNKQLYLRVNKLMATKAKKMVSSQEITGPALIYVQSAMEPAALPEQIKKGFMHGKAHTAAFFDDKDNFREFYVGYRKGFGIVRHKKMANLARFYYRELLALLGEKPQTVAAKPVNLTPIKHIVTDLDGVLAMTDEPLPPTMLASIIEFLKKGGKLFVATEDIEENVDKRVGQALPPELRKGLLIFSDGAAKAFTYDAGGSRQMIEEYCSRSRLDGATRQTIRGILDRDLAGLFEYDTRQNRISPDYRIDLHNVKSPRNDFIAKLSALLAKAGIKVKAYKVGKTSVKIVLQHKEDAVRYLAQKGLIDPATTIIFGDNARQNQVDRGLLTALPAAICINIGNRSTTIGKENPNIIQLPDEGINCTSNLLATIVKYGGIDKPSLIR